MCYRKVPNSLLLGNFAEFLVQQLKKTLICAMISLKQ